MKDFGKIEVVRTPLALGVETPFSVVHMTDNHITRRDPDQGPEYDRAACFDENEPGRTENYSEQAFSYAKEHGYFVLHTGDFLDFLSEANYAYMEEQFAGVDHLYAAGNHDFCHCVGLAVEDAPYKWQYMKKTAPHMKYNMLFASRVVGGVNFVALDDSYYLISDGQTAMLRAEAAKGLPIVLMLHVPLYSPRLSAKIMEENPCAYVTGAPEELLRSYPEYRCRQQTPDEATKRAVDYILGEPAIRAVVAGHTHCDFEEALPNGVMQYVTRGTFQAGIRQFDIT